jgi:hypothetical protein
MIGSTRNPKVAHGGFDQTRSQSGLKAIRWPSGIEFLALLVESSAGSPPRLPPRWFNT